MKHVYNITTVPVLYLGYHSARVVATSAKQALELAEKIERTEYRTVKNGGWSWWFRSDRTEAVTINPFYPENILKVVRENPVNDAETLR